VTEEFDKLLHAGGDLDELASELDRLGTAFPKRVNADPEKVEQGLAQLVLTLVELLRQLMERQALRRMEQGTLSDEQIERLEAAVPADAVAGQRYSAEEMPTVGV
jgi:hypothetical protein